MEDTTWAPFENSANVFGAAPHSPGMAMERPLSYAPDTKSTCDVKIGLPLKVLSVFRPGDGGSPLARLMLLNFRRVKNGGGCVSDHFPPDAAPDSVSGSSEGRFFFWCSPIPPTKPIALTSAAMLTTLCPLASRRFMSSASLCLGDSSAMLPSHPYFRLQIRFRRANWLPQNAGQLPCRFALPCPKPALA